MSGSLLTRPLPEHPLPWRGPDLDWRTEGLYVLSPDDLAQIDAALAHTHRQGDLDVSEITRATFPLASFGERLHALGQRLQYGPGFVMVRGLPIAQYPLDDLARIYVGLGAYIGDPINQSYAGDLLGHVMDVSREEPLSRAYRRGGGQMMHTDSSDVVGLMCVRAARSGGASRIASSLAVYQDIAARRPDLAQLLRRGFYLARSALDARHSTSATSLERVPVYSEASGAPAIYYVASYARSAATYGYTLTEQESEALDEVQRVAASPGFYLDMDFSVGDIQFLNNRTILHGRTDYVDAEDLDARRYLMRLWLQMPTWPPLADAQVFHKAADHALWSQNRRPRMDLPTRQFADLRRKAQTIGSPRA